MAKLQIHVGKETLAVEADLSRTLAELKVEALAEHAVKLEGRHSAWLLPDAPLEKQGVSNNSSLTARKFSIFDDYVDGDDVEEPFAYATTLVKGSKLKQVQRDEAIFLAAHEAAVRGHKADVSAMLPAEWRGSAAAPAAAEEARAIRDSLTGKSVGACKHAYIFMACALFGAAPLGVCMKKRAQASEQLFKLLPRDEQVDAEAETVEALALLAKQVEQVSIMHATFEEARPSSPAPPSPSAERRGHSRCPSMSRKGSSPPVQSAASEQLLTVLNDLRLRIPEIATVPRRDVCKAATKVSRTASLLVTAVKNYVGDNERDKELVFRSGRVLTLLKQFVEMVKDGVVDPRLYLETMKALDDTGSCLVWLLPPEKIPLNEEVEGLMAAVNHRVPETGGGSAASSASSTPPMSPGRCARIQKIRLTDGRIFSALTDPASPPRAVIADTCALLNIVDPDEYGLMYFISGRMMWVDITRPLADQVEGDRLLLLKKRLFFFQKQMLKGTPEDRHVLYLKVKDFVLHSGHFSCTKDEAIMLAAFDARLELGPCRPRYDTDFMGFLPIKKRTLVTASKVAAKYEELELHKLDSDYDVEGLYISQALQNRTLGMTLFHVKIQASEKDKVTEELIGVTCDRFHRLTPKRKDVIKEYDFKLIRKLKYEDDSIVIDFGPEGIYTAATKEGADIAFLILRYLRQQTKTVPAPIASLPMVPIDELIAVIEHRVENMRPVHSHARTLEQSINELADVKTPFMKGLNDFFALAKEAKVGDIAFCRSRTLDLVHRCRVVAGTMPTKLGMMVIKEGTVVLMQLRDMLLSAKAVISSPHDESASRQGAIKIAQLDEAYSRMLQWLCTYRDMIAASDAVEDMASGLRSVCASDHKTVTAVTRTISDAVDRCIRDSREMALAAPLCDPCQMRRLSEKVVNDFAILCTALRSILAKHVQYVQWSSRISVAVSMFREIASAIDDAATAVRATSPAEKARATPSPMPSVCVVHSAPPTSASSHATSPAPRPQSPSGLRGFLPSFTTTSLHLHSPMAAVTPPPVPSGWAVIGATPEVVAMTDRAVRLLHSEAIPCLITAETDSALSVGGTDLKAATAEFRIALQTFVGVEREATSQKRMPETLITSLNALSNANQRLLRAAASPQNFMSREQHEKIIVIARDMASVISRHIYNCLITAAGVPTSNPNPPSADEVERACVKLLPILVAPALSAAAAVAASPETRTRTKGKETAPKRSGSAESSPLKENAPKVSESAEDTTQEEVSESVEAKAKEVSESAPKAAPPGKERREEDTGVPKADSPVPSHYDSRVTAMEKSQSPELPISEPPAQEAAAAQEPPHDQEKTPSEPAKVEEIPVKSASPVLPISELPAEPSEAERHSPVLMEPTPECPSISCALVDPASPHSATAPEPPAAPVLETRSASSEVQDPSDES